MVAGGRSLGRGEQIANQTGVGHGINGGRGAGVVVGGQGRGLGVDRRHRLVLVGEGMATWVVVGHYLAKIETLSHILRGRTRRSQVGGVATPGTSQSAVRVKRGRVEVTVGRQKRPCWSSLDGTLKDPERIGSPNSDCRNLG